MRRNITLFSCLLLLIGALLACGASSNTNTGSTSTSSSQSSAPTTAPAKHFKLNDVVKVGDTWNITVESAKTSPGSDYNKPTKASDVFLIVTVAMKNLSSQEQNVSSLVQFNLQDTTGQKYNPTIDPDEGATLDGKVEAGSPLKGVIAYEVPANVKSYTFNFQNDIVSSGQTTWDLSV